jgi:hypothetical protein
LARSANAQAHSKGTGASGTIESIATSAGGSFDYFQSHATVDVNGTLETEARASLARSDPGQAPAAGLAGAAFISAHPLVSDYNSLTAATPAIRTAFGGVSGALGIVELRSTSPSTVPADAVVYHTSVSSGLIATRFSSGDGLVVGLVSPLVTGSGFGELNFQFYREGELQLDQTFTTVAAAQTYFTDHVLNLGSLATDNDGTLDIEFKLNLPTASPNAGFGASLVFGRRVGQWSFNSSQGNWNQNSNWSSGAFPDAPTANADFLGTSTFPSSHILLNGNRSAGTLTFDNPNSYIIDGPTTASSLTLGSFSVPAAINVLHGNHSITAKTIVNGDLVITTAPGASISLAALSNPNGHTITKLDAGTLTISGAQKHGFDAAFTVAGGLVNLNSNVGTAATASGRRPAEAAGYDGHVSRRSDR